VEDIRIKNVEALGTSLIVIVDAIWMSGTDNFNIHIERPFDVGSL
jgi:hypothetical protein